MAADEKITEGEFTRLYDSMKELGTKIDKVGTDVNNIKVDIAKMESKFVTKKEIGWLIGIIISVSIAAITYFSQKPLLP